MTKLLLATLLLLSFSILSAQTTHTDSMLAFAKKDVRKFRLSKNDLRQFTIERRQQSKAAMTYAHSGITLAQRQQFKKNFRVIISDYFKPNRTDVRDTSLLKDSAYVQAYRQAAYVKTIRKYSLGGAIWIVMGLVFVALIIAFYRN